MWIIDLLDDLMHWVWAHPWKAGFGGLACVCLVSGALYLR